ncbi:trypsin alpha-like [Drosophila takahashii]|uniref:trypsin alpha-like n=1 Tax=Drosophila takahashii TaxID=29030 RepID=UPI001CF89FB1|nr:trypsin alpha-like [Drosophila takahashii]
MLSKIIIILTILGIVFRFTTSTEVHRIINGNYASAKQLPYQVFFDKLDLSNLHVPLKWTPFCGGTIISEKTILTAAHCLDDPNIYAVKIYFGAVNILNETEVGQRRLVVKRDNFVVHEQYDKHLMANDIALIKLPITLLFDDYIRAARLPNTIEQYKVSEATVSGWGYVNVSPENNNFIPTSDPKLKYFNTLILSDEECQLWTTKLGPTYSATLLCTAPGENTACRGDSGGPLVVRHYSNFVLLGITSYNFGICESHYPTVYTKVTSYLYWIHDNSGGYIHAIPYA